MPYADNDGARLHWEERGDGSPLLLVMGHTYPSAIWYPVLDALSAKHRLIWFDNRGTGKSVGRLKGLTVGDMARDAFAVMDAAGVDSAHVYGVSMGGGIILEMARQQPQRVRSLLLGCTLAKTPDLPGVPTLLKPLLLLPAPILGRLLKAMTAKKRQTEHPYGTAAAADRVAHDLAVVAANPTPLKTSVAQSKAVNAYSITADEVRALTMPALVLHGDEDVAVAYEQGVKLHEYIAHSELVTFKGAGHNYFIAAGDEANAAALDFLRRVDAEQKLQPTG